MSKRSIRKKRKIDIPLGDPFEAMRKWVNYSSHHPSWCMDCWVEDFHAGIPLSEVVVRKCNHAFKYRDFCMIAKEK